MLRFIRAVFTGRVEGDQAIGRRLREEAARYQPEVSPALRCRIRAALAAGEARRELAPSGARIGWQVWIPAAVAAMAAMVLIGIMLTRPRRQPDLARTEADRTAVRVIAGNLLPLAPLTSGDDVRALENAVDRSLRGEFEALMADVDRGARAVIALLPASPARGGAKADF